MRLLNLITHRLSRILSPIEDNPPSRPFPPPPHNPKIPQKQSHLPFPLALTELDSPFFAISEHKLALSQPQHTLLDRQIQVGLPLEYTFPSPSYMKDLPPEPSPYPPDATPYILLDSVDSLGSF